MYIKSITLDGFKSYQKHTEITGFSKKFNAITGYNGSGKSNVLDSICFILGINKLDNIRAKSMAELISHGGTKATVQIRFDNTDKDGSPFGMEHLDEIVVQRTITAQATGKGCATNYTLNGHAATNSKIHDFFRSIGLNVNNPHFLIMQGRITTVLNMKPEEILGMVEEAAGTKMYDQKKKEAEKTLFLKQAKLKEIDKIFEINIDPRMEKFREDRKNMVEVTRLTKLKDNAQRKVDAYQYYITVESAKRDAEMIETVKEEVEELGRKGVEIQTEITKKEEEKKAVETEQKNETPEAELLKNYRAKQIADVQMSTERSALIGTIEGCERNIKLTQTNISNDRKAVQEKRDLMAQVRSENDGEINKFKEEEALVSKMRDELESLTRGTVANDQGQQVGLAEEIQDSLSRLAQLDADVRTAVTRKVRLAERVEFLTNEHAKKAESCSDEIAELTSSQKQVETLNNRLQALKFDADADQSLRDKILDVTQQIKNLEANNLALLQEIQNGRFTMEYTPPPVANFDAKRDIIGFLAYLVRLKEGKDDYAAALEIALSGILGNLVVRNQDVARVLIDSKAFTSRRTMIPVSENSRNDSAHFIITDHVVEEANRIAASYGEQVVRAIDLVEFPDFVGSSFKNCLGSILICKNLDCARDIAYSPRIKTRVVTLRGDDVKSSGVMSGGKAEFGSQFLLLEMRPYHENKDKIDQLVVELAELEKKTRASEANHQKYQSLSSQLLAAQRKLSQLKNNMKNSALGVVQRELEENRADLEATTRRYDESSKALAEQKIKVRGLEGLRSNDKGEQERLKKQLAEELAVAEENLAAHRDVAELAKRNVMRIAATVDDLATTIAAEEEKLKGLQEELAQLETELPVMDEKSAALHKEAVEAEREMEERKIKARQMSTRIGKISRDIDILRKEEAKISHKKEDREKEVTRLFESEKSNRKHAESTLKKFEWLSDEQVHFNKKGGLFDFEGYTNQKGTAEIKDLTDRIETLERRLCLKNVSNLDTCEAKVMDIKSKRERIDNDFDVLRRTIGVLDTRKVDELIRAHESVNDDFGKIFTCLLPDAHAQLVPPEGKTVCDGLEVKVSFNGVVKESLHELSGGQRSLVALSLILAMLKFRPAPLYILDEVDAALDLSHTANIGMMIRSHFQNSQFIIVSLKQGMFSNADVLFQTHFADGHSTCTRLVGAALEKAKKDAKLAKQADEMDASEQETRKRPGKAAAPAKAPARASSRLE